MSTRIPDVDRYRRLRELFDRAGELPPDQWAPFLERECRDDDGLRADVHRLLRQAQAADDQRLFAPSTRESTPTDTAAQGLSCQSPAPGPPVSAWARCGSGTGQTLGRFELIAAVGAGAFGTVYRARDTQLDRTVAVKVPRSAYLPSGPELERFLREARSAAQLRHPAIVPVFEVGREGGLPYLVSEFVEGVSLADRLTAGRLTYREAAALVAAVAEALDYAHRRGVVHRDVKPSNIMLHPDGTPAVMDFGLAKREAGEVSMTLEGQVLGTPAYMSPEQARGEAHAVDGRSDVYSLGVVLYQLLSGELPFRGNTRMLLHQVLRDEPRPPRALDDRVPRDLETVCLKAMAKEPSRRYATAGELAADLGRWLVGEPVRARPAGTLERGWRWARRYPAEALLGAASMAGAVALMGLVFFAVAFGKVNQAYRAETAARQKTESARRTADEQRAAAETSNRRAVAALETSRRYRYILSINQAAVALEENLLAKASALLDDCPPGLRGWEWHYLDRMRAAPPMTLQGHRLVVRGIAYSPDGGRLATVGADRTARVWDAATGRELLVRDAQEADLTAVCWSPDGERIATAGDDGAVQIWDAGTGQLRLAMAGKGPPARALSFDPAGRRLAVARDERRAESWQESGAEVEVVDPDDGRTLATLRGQPDSILTLEFSPAGDRLLTAARDRTVRIWDAARVEPVATLGQHTADVVIGDGVLAGREFSGLRAAWSPDGRRVAVGGDERLVKLYDPATGAELAVLRGHSAGIGSIGFSPDGSRIVTVSYDRTARIWDATRGEEIRRLRSPDQTLHRGAMSPDGRHVAASTFDGRVFIWDLARGEGVIAIRHPHRMLGATFSPDGGHVAACGEGNVVRIWDAATGVEVRRLWGHRAGVYQVAYHPDGRQLAAGGFESDIRIWDVASGRAAAVLRPHAERIEWLAYSPEGVMLYSADRSWVPLAWDLRSGGRRPLLTEAGRAAFGASLSGDGRRLTYVSADALLCIRDLEAGRDVVTIAARPETSPTTAASSPDGRLIASGGSDRIIRLWDTASGALVRELQGHAAGVRGVRFDAGGRRLFSWSVDAMVKIWDPVTGRELLTLPGHEGMIIGLAESPEGHRLVSSGYDGVVRIWDARPRSAESEEQDRQIADARWAELVRRGAEAAERAAQWPAAVWYLDRLAAIDPGDGLVRDRREVARARAAGKPLAQDQAHGAAMAGRWELAEGPANQAVEAFPDSPHHRYVAAMVQLARGDREGYARSCRALLDRAGGLRDPFQKTIAARACAIGRAGIDPDRVVALAEEGLYDGRSDGPGLSFPLYVVGLALDNADRPEQAIEHYTRALEFEPGSGMAMAALAHAHARLGDMEAARRRLVEASRWVEAVAGLADPGWACPGRLAPHWYDWVEFRIQLDQARALALDADFPTDPFAR